MLSLGRLKQKESAPRSPCSVSLPSPPLSVSLPEPPINVLLAALPVRLLLSELPVPLMLTFFVSSNCKFSTLSLSVKLTLD
ncbi:hypothetical protein CXB77_02010 [Chromatium okenii]|uniref:Uncharacterized protein n=1 Tax=Chromatium okenii TaxID=61644 RepID=A0A2S7XV57_9GAMM|nr:hypothetical protein CXB77_02010 [Chromatium okenii]